MHVKVIHLILNDYLINQKNGMQVALLSACQGKNDNFVTRIF